MSSANPLGPQGPLGSQGPLGPNGPLKSLKSDNPTLKEAEKIGLELDKNLPFLCNMNKSTNQVQEFMKTDLYKTLLNSPFKEIVNENLQALNK